MDKPDPRNAVVTGLGVIGFTLFYLLVGIFPFKLGWEWHVYTVSENPLAFWITVAIFLILGSVALAWGLVNRK